MSDISPETRARIRAIKAKMQGEDAAAAPPATSGGGKPAEAGPPAEEAAAPAGDQASKIAAIKARMAQGGGAAAPAGGGKPAEAAPAAAASGGGEDVQARIAALKAKMESGKTAAPQAGKAPAPGARAAAAAAKTPRKGGGSKNIYPVEPINRKGFGDERLYGENSLNLWFVVGGVALLIAVVLMWKRDHDRDWKQWQQRYRENEIARLQDSIGEVEQTIDPTELEQLQQRIDDVQQQIDQHAAHLDELREEENALEGEYYGANQTFQIAKADLDELRYNFEEERLQHGGDTELLTDSSAEFEEQEQELADLKAKADDIKLKLDAKKKEVAEAVAARTTLEQERDKLLEPKQRLERSLAKIDHSFFNDKVRNAPLVDMLAPTLKVQKIVLDKVKDNYNFMYVRKVDMCITCHVSIDKPYYSDWDTRDPAERPEGDPGERVLNAHPRLDLFVADGSPHPMAEFGCTVCHQGRGQAVEFERTFHVPAADQYETADEKEARWVADFGFQPERHYWDWPMVPEDKIYSACWQCHHDTERIPAVPEYNESRALVEDLGCYGCHKIEGLEYLRKPGPDLTYVADKIDEDWMAKWVMSPRSFRPTTRMPHFWDQSNTGAPASATIDPEHEWNNNSDTFVDDYRVRNQVEARAITAYVYDLSRGELAKGGYELEQPPARAGDPERGKQLFHDRGCLGCHSLEDEGWTENGHGPELSGIGGKVSPDWLFSWIRDPKRYFPTTIMPNLRLGVDEAWDITAFLMQKHNEEFDARQPPRRNQEVLDGIAVEYLSAVAGEDWAKGQLETMRSETGDTGVELYVGEKLFGRYGCSGCHLVPGHYDDKGIGTELTKEGLKDVARLDYGFESSEDNPDAIPHTRHDFFRLKMRDPRVFDRMPVVADGPDGKPVIERYDMKIKRPDEKLKMPNFGLDDHEVELMVQFLMGLREDGLEPGIKHSLDADGALVEQGTRLITKLNCIGCHRVGQYPRILPVPGEDMDAKLTSLEDIIDGEAFDYGLWAAAPFRVDDQQIYAPHDWITDEFYDPAEEEDADVYEWIEDNATAEQVPDRMLVYGHGEGGMGNYLDERAMRPPILRGEGAKVEPDWLFDFLIRPYTVRTHVELRMPTFGLTEQESLALVRWFAAQADQPWPFEIEGDTEPDPDLLALGHDKFANVLKCNSCHPAGGAEPSNPDKTNWGPDLAMAADRLKTDWIRKWLLDPQLQQPGTRMPSFFGEFADGGYDGLYDDYQEQVRALQHYLKHMQAWDDQSQQ